MKLALLIIDLLQDFFKEGLLAMHRERLVSLVNQLVDTAHRQNIPVIWVRQEYKADLSDAPLYNRINNKKPFYLIFQPCLLTDASHLIRSSEHY